MAIRKGNDFSVWRICPARRGLTLAWREMPLAGEVVQDVA